jgi:UDP-GlcNAc:undecaprenyl-phosphate GlcNAc-1-phosphate transferase
MGHSHLQRGAHPSTRGRRSPRSDAFLSFVFPVYFGIPSGWAFLLLGSGSWSARPSTLAPLGRRKRLTVAAEADGDDPVAAIVFDELGSPEPVACDRARSWRSVGCDGFGAGVDGFGTGVDGFGGDGSGEAPARRRSAAAR